MAGTRAIATRPSPSLAPLLFQDTAFDPEIAPFGFARGDQLDPARRGAPASFAPIFGAQNQPGNTDLHRSVRTRMQALHQSENSRAAGRAQPRFGSGGIGPTSATYTVDGHKYQRGEGDKLWLRLESKGRSYARWAKNHPDTARAIGRPRRIARMVRSLRHSFKEVGSPLARHASKFVVAGYLSGYDPRFIAAFAAQESGWGRSTPGNAPYNYWGWTVYTGNQSSAVTAPFKHAGTAFRYFGRQLGKHYGGAKSVYSNIWAPYAADPNHERVIASILRDNFGGNPNNIRFPRRLRDA